MGFKGALPSGIWGPLKGEKSHSTKHCALVIWREIDWIWLVAAVVQLPTSGPLFWIVPVVSREVTSTCPLEVNCNWQELTIEFSICRHAHLTFVSGSPYLEVAKLLCRQLATTQLQVPIDCLTWFTIWVQISLSIMAPSHTTDMLYVLETLFRQAGSKKLEHQENLVFYVCISTQS